MRKIAGILMILAGLLDLFGSLAYLLGGGMVAMLGGMLGMGADTLNQEMARSGAGPGSEQFGAATGMVTTAGGGIALFGVFLLVTGILLIVAAVFLFKERKPRLIVVAAVLAIVAELAGIGLTGPGVANAIGIVAGVLALLAVRRMARPDEDDEVAPGPGGAAVRRRGFDRTEIMLGAVIGLGALLIAVGIGGYLSGGGTSGGAGAGMGASAPQSSSAAPALRAPAPRIPGDAPAEHVAYLETSPPQLSFGSGRPAGPATLRIASASGNTVMLDVGLPPVPGIDGAPESLAEIRVVSVETTPGTNIYAPDSGLESQFFRRISLSRRDDPQPYLSGTRQIQVKKGADAGKTTQVVGDVVLTLPEGLEVLDLTTLQAGARADGSAGSVSIEKIDGDSVSLAVEAPQTRIVAIEGIDAAGKAVDRAGWSKSMVGDTLHATLSFRNPVSAMRVTLASGTREYVVPYVVGR